MRDMESLFSGETKRLIIKAYLQAAVKKRGTAFFQWFVALEGRKVGSLKRRVRSHLAGAKHISKSKCTNHHMLGPLLEVAMSKKCTPLWREAHLEVKIFKAHQVRTTSGSWDVEKVHAVVARSTFASEKAKSTSRSDHFLEVEMSKECTPLWREAHFEVKMYKAPQCRTTFGSWDVEKVHAVVARSTFRSQNVQNSTCSDHFWRFRCRFAWQAQGIVHLVKSEPNVRVL